MAEFDDVPAEDVPDQDEAVTQTGAAQALPLEEPAEQATDLPVEPAAPADVAEVGVPAVAGAEEQVAPVAEAATEQAGPEGATEAATVEPAAPEDGAAPVEEATEAPSEAGEAAVPAGEEPLDPEVAAIAASLGTGSFDSIAPGTVTATGIPSEEALTEVVRGDTVSIWPFVGYVGVWVVLAALSVWQLLQTPTDQAVFDTQFYTLVVAGGVALTAVGPVLALVVWLWSWIGKEGVSKASLFFSALLNGAIATFAGVAIWWVALVVLDYLRLGRPL